MMKCFKIMSSINSRSVPSVHISFMFLSFSLETSFLQVFPLSEQS